MRETPTDSPIRPAGRLGEVNRALVTALLACTAPAAACGRADPEPATPATTVFRPDTARKSDIPGEALARALGCSACHADMPAATVAAPTLRAPPGAHGDAARIFAILRAPVRVPDDPGAARMPDFHLDDAEALALALYLGGESSGGSARADVDALETARRSHDGVSARDGERIYGALNCAGCHAPAGTPAPKPAPTLALEGARVTRTWLARYLRRPSAIRPFGAEPGSGTRMPDFGLSGDEADSIAAFLLARTIDLPDFDAPPITRFASDKAASLLGGRLPCRGCHIIDDGAGGRIGPSLEHVSARLRPAFVRAMLDDPRHVVPGTIMPKPILPAATLDLIARYLLAERDSRPAIGEVRKERAGYLSLIETPVLGQADESVAGSYTRSCAPCHGAGGDGDGYNARYLSVAPANHADGEAMALRPDDSLFDAIATGGWTMDRSAEMPAFGGSIEPASIRALVAYIRTLCRCTQPAWAESAP